MTSSRKPLLIIALGFILVLYQQTVSAQSYPTGTYSLSCNNITTKNNILSASCKTLNGNYHQTSMKDLTACLNSIASSGDIGNIDGNLICIPDIPKGDPGFKFPEAETRVNNWIYKKDLDRIYRHAWGIWFGLTQFVGEVDGTPVRAFETWATTSNMLFRTENESVASLKSFSKPQKPQGLELNLPNQFKNKSGNKGNLLKEISPPTATDGDTNIFVSVAYNPPAAQHAISNRLFLQSTLDQYLENGYQEVPNFPNNAITIKPVYKIIPANTPKGVYKFPGWPGTPSPARAFSEKNWNSCVYININVSGNGGNSIDKDCKGMSPASTFFLNNFIHQKITSTDANYLSKQLNINVNEGDYAILVGMHVTSREIKRWTWQTFWWSANPSVPFLPSSKTIASKRPTQYLGEAPHHYAMSVAYQMVDMAQPISGGENVGDSVIGYNPHLEAGFDPSVFQIIRKINGTVENKYGVQTNCMTCHNLALYDPKTDYRVNNGSNRQKPYGTDYYMSLNDKTFDNVLKLDFAWSILGAMKLDSKKK